MLSNKQTKREGFLNRGLDLVSVDPLDWSVDDTCAIKPSSKNGLRILCIKMSVNPHKIKGRNNA